jgi:Na+/proline symporter
MHWIDYLILALVLLSLLVVGFVLARRSGESTAEYYIAGRKMPWWLIGFSDLAVGLNTSNMLQDSRKVRQDGLMGMMYVWGAALKSCITGVFFDRMWRRARFKTQMEFYHARYSGWQADFARIYDTVVFGGFVTSIWAAIGLVGMKKVITVVFGLPPTVPIFGLEVSTEVLAVVAVVGIALTYSAAAGARGIYWTDFIEFFIAVIPLYFLFFIVYGEVGGSVGLRENLESLPDKSKYLNFLQPFSIIYIYFFLINPLLDQGGFNPGMQRTLSLKDERQVIYSMILKGIGGFVLRGMPFLAIGMIGIFLVDDQYLMEHFAPLLTPEGAAVPDWERAFPTLVERYLPIGLMGMMASAFICAFMSSFDSNLHLTGTLIVNDFYRGYIVKNKSDKHYVFATKVVMTIGAVVTVLIGIYADDILYLGYLALTISLGGGWFKVLRLIWWRVNGTAEVAAQMFSLLVFAFVLSPLGSDFIVAVAGSMGLEGNDAFYVIRNMLAAGSCTVFAFIFLLVSKPEPMDKLCSFYRRMRPFGFWGPVRAELEGKVKSDPVKTQAALAISILAIVWGACIGSMCLLVAYWTGAILGGVSILIGSFFTRKVLHKLYPPDEEIVEYDDGEGSDEGVVG